MVPNSTMILSSMILSFPVDRFSSGTDVDKIIEDKIIWADVQTVAFSIANAVTSSEDGGHNFYAHNISFPEPA